MIKNFKDKETQRIFDGYFSSKLPQSIQRTAFRKLLMMNHVCSLQELRQPPSNHLERLQGDRFGQYSIRINDQYRICFCVDGDGFTDVEIVDYH